jgi:predicted permease
MGDLRYTLRLAARTPLVMASAVLSLALGMGANLAIYRGVSSVLTASLPVRHLDRLVSIYGTDQKNAGAGGYTFFPVSYPNYVDYRAAGTAFSDLVAHTFIQVNLLTGTEPEQVAGRMVTGNYFDVLGVRAALGRTFLPEEDLVPGAHPVVVLSHGLWQRAFGADRAVIGRTVRVDGRPFTVVGVAPAGFRGLDTLSPAELWVPMMMHQQVFSYDEYFNQRRWRMFQLVGRLKPGASLRQAALSLEDLARRLEHEYPNDNQGRGVRLVPLAQAAVNPDQRQVLVRAGAFLFTISGCVLLIACINVANLLLVRGSDRRQEIALRLALGAGRGHILRQLLGESLLLSIVGCLAALPIARLSLDALWRVRPPFIAESVLERGIDGRVLAFTAALALATTLLCGLVPALAISRPDLISTLRGHSTIPGGRRLGAQDLFIVAQVAFSFVVLIAAGLFVRSLRNTQRIDPGFRAERLLVLRTDLRTQGYGEPQGRQFYRRLLEDLQSLPGVAAATLAENPPLFPFGALKSVLIEDLAPAGPRDAVLVGANSVDLGYFATVGVPIEQGRAFSAQDRDGGRPVCIVNRAMADRFWPGRSPLGRRLWFAGGGDKLEIVGVARNSKYARLGEEPQPYLYLPSRQHYSPIMHLHVRTAAAPGPVASAVRQAVRRLDRQLPVADVQWMSELIERSLWGPRMAAGLLSAFGLLGLALTAIGIYGVVSYAVRRRRREIAIRIVLGSRPGGVVELLLARILALAALGVALGLLAALLTGRLFAGLLYHLGPADPATLAEVAAIFAAVAALAAYVPSRRASRQDPKAVLAAE